MILQIEVLLFDKEKITEKQILEHVRYYTYIANKGIKLVEKSPKEAMKCLKEIRKTMSLEYNYYTKVKIQSIMWKNHVYNDYYYYITDAFSKQTRPNGYEMLLNNLDEVAYAAGHYYEYFGE